MNLETDNTEKVDANSNEVQSADTEIATKPKRKRKLSTFNLRRNHKCTFEGCNKSYTQSAHLKRHYQTHSDIIKTYVCQICSVNISTLSNLKRHYNRAHNPSRELHCEKCNIKFRKKHHYERHMTIGHGTPEIFKCDKCGKEFINNLKLLRHSKTHMHKCPFENCGEVFNKRSLLVKHKYVHNPIRFSCSQCNKVFLTSNGLKCHIKTHTDDRPSIPCPYKNCKRLYYFKRNLNQHIKSKHTGKKFHCDICDLKVSTKQKIEEHIIKIHMIGRKSYIKKKKSQRSDVGVPKKSMVTKLSGIQLTLNAEVKLMKRAPTALLRDGNIQDSFSEEDRASDFSATGA